MKKSILFLLLGIFFIPSLTAATHYAYKLLSDSNLKAHDTLENNLNQTAEYFYPKNNDMQRLISRAESLKENSTPYRRGSFYAHNNKLYLEKEKNYGTLYIAITFTDWFSGDGNSMIIYFCIDDFNTYSSIAITYAPWGEINSQSVSLMTVYGYLPNIKEKTGEQDIQKYIEENIFSLISN
jgi:hypothetical protein